MNLLTEINHVSKKQVVEAGVLIVISSVSHVLAGSLVVGWEPPTRDARWCHREEVDTAGREVCGKQITRIRRALVDSTRQKIFELW